MKEIFDSSYVCRGTQFLTYMSIDLDVSNVLGNSIFIQNVFGA